MSEPMNVFDANPVLKAKIEAKLAEQKAAQIQATPPVMPVPINPPSSGLELVEFTEDTIDDGAKSKLKNYDITQAYLRWFSPKDMKDSGNGNFLTNCFNANGHSNGDSNPSLCLKTGENVYTCYGCNISGDMVDLAGVFCGTSDGVSGVPDNLVHEVVKTACINLFPEMANGFRQVGEKSTWIYDPEPVIDFSQYSENVEDVDVNEPGKYVPTFDWENLLPNGSGIRRHMELIKEMGLPEEFGIPMWMIVVSTIMGNDIRLPGKAKDYVCLFYILLVAPPNTGKSLSWQVMLDLLNHEMRYNPFDENTNTFKVLNEISSGEILVQGLDNWTKEEKNLAVTPQGKVAPKFVPKRQPNIRSGIYYDELETLISKVKIKGSTLANKLTTAWTGFGSELTEHSRTRASVSVSDYHVNVFTSTQDDKVGSFVEAGDISSGFWSRWTYAFSKSDPYNDSEDDPFSGGFDHNAYIDGVKLHVRQLRSYVEARKRLKDNRLTFTQEGHEEFKKFWKENVRKIQRDQNNILIRDLMARSDVLFIRLCMFYSVSLLEPQISITAVRLAEHHFMVHIANAEQIFDQLSDQSLEISEYIESIVTKRAGSVDKHGEPNPIRHKEVLRYVGDKYKGRITDEGIERIMLNMLRGGTIQKVDANQGKQSKIGRPKAVRYVPND
ncbi:DNA primase [Gordonia phage RobinSparkles]|nr:DNA primase [Gordonia phage RobinSparkles]